jgi:hypothetical protein
MLNECRFNLVWGWAVLQTLFLIVTFWTEGGDALWKQVEHLKRYFKPSSRYNNSQNIIIWSDFKIGYYITFTRLSVVLT